MRRSFLLIYCLIMSLLYSTSTTMAEQDITVGSGPATSQTFAFGGSICRMTNKSRKEHGVRCLLKSTGGSLHNLHSLVSGDYQFGFANSEAQFHAYGGSGAFKDIKGFKKLRSVFSFSPEPIVLLVEMDAPITSAKDVIEHGFRVRGNAARALNKLPDFQCNPCTTGCADENCNCSDDNCKIQRFASNCREMQSTALVLHANTRLAEEIVEKCNLRAVSFDPDEVAELLDANTFLGSSTILPGRFNNTEQIVSFGTSATLVAHEDVPAEVVYSVVKSIFDDFDTFRSLHPSLAKLRLQNMISDSLTAPLHEGAERYFKEKGMM